MLKKQNYSLTSLNTQSFSSTKTSFSHFFLFPQTSEAKLKSFLLDGTLFHTCDDFLFTSQFSNAFKDKNFNRQKS